MYKFNVYWTDKLKIDFLQRVILVHSYLYYEKDNPVWQDRKYDEISKQLVAEQSKHSTAWIKQNTMYGYAFYDFDGSTGFDLWDRVKDEHRGTIQQIAAYGVKHYGRG